MTHVVVGIIIKQDNPLSYLLVSSNKDFGDFSGYYYPPAGHVEAGEGELATLKREIKEELDLNVIRAEKIIDTEGDVKDQRTTWYFCDVDSYDFTIDNQELQSAGFFTQQEMKAMKIWPATQKVFEKYIFNNDANKNARTLSNL